MISESLLHIPNQEEEDAFFKRKRKRRPNPKRTARRTKRLARRQTRRSQPKRVARRQKRQRFFKDIGQIYRDAGGATAIGAAIDTVTLHRNNDPANPPLEMGSDLDIDFGAPELPEEEAEGIPTVVYVLGGVLVIGGIGLFVMQYQKTKRT